MLKVIVSHPNTQYVHRLLLALLKQGQLSLFYTSLYFHKHRFPGNLVSLLPGVLARPLLELLKRRDFSGIPPGKIAHFPSLEIKREIGKRMYRGREEKHYFHMALEFDRRVAKRLKPGNYDCLIGYEMACEQSFAAAQAQGKFTILDLAQVHYQTLERLSARFEGFRYLSADRDFFEMVNARKHRELEKSSYIFCLSALAKQSLLQAGIAEETIYVLNLGHDPAKFYPKAVYNQQGPLKLLYVGTITRRKGLDLLLDVFSSVKKRHPDAELTIVGPAGDGSLMLEAFELPLTYHPFTTHDELRALYQHADLFVFPSYLDSWAMVVIEAMACGTPVIVSDQTGAKDAVEQGGGWVVPAGDMHELEKAILVAASDRSLLEEKGREAALIASRYTWEHYESQVAAALAEICSRRNTEKEGH